LVLYDKKTNFLGIGQSELSMLGYEDIEEFKSYCDDFADLFVNHPGYISKFKNFSWIDYSLHSGVPNKNVILRHKNGTDIEAKLNIFEIFLINEINEEKTIYNVEVSTTSTKDDYTTTADPYINQKIKPIQEEDKTNKISSISQPKKVIEEPTNKMAFDDFSIEDFEEPKILTEISDMDVDSSLKEKIEPETEKLLVDKFPEDLNIDYEPTIKLKIDLPEDIPSQKSFCEVTPVEMPLEIKPLDTADTAQKESDEEETDFTQIAEDTDMDIGDLAMFIGEFIKDSKKISKDLHKNSDTLTAKNKIIELKGIASNLKMKNFIEILDLMLTNCDNLEFENFINKFDLKIKNLENQLF